MSLSRYPIMRITFDTFQVLYCWARYAEGPCISSSHHIPDPLLLTTNTDISSSTPQLNIPYVHGHGRRRREQSRWGRGFERARITLHLG